MTIHNRSFQGEPSIIVSEKVDQVRRKLARLGIALGNRSLALLNALGIWRWFGPVGAPGRYLLTPSRTTTMVWADDLSSVEACDEVLLEPGHYLALSVLFPEHGQLAAELMDILLRWQGRYLHAPLKEKIAACGELLVQVQKIEAAGFKLKFGINRPYSNVIQIVAGASVDESFIRQSRFAVPRGYKRRIVRKPWEPGEVC